MSGPVSGDERSADLLIVGTGLIGTSVGLAVRPGWDVLLADRDEAALRTAVRRGAGRVRRGRERARLALVCVPPDRTAVVLAGLQRSGVARSYSHVCSVQAGVQDELRTASPDPAAVCGSHPMAGREQSGPAAAVAGLFAGRPWVLCPEPDTRPEAVADVRHLVAAVGAQAVTMPAGRHDAAVALVSHLPQVAASALAAQLAGLAGLAGPAGPAGDPLPPVALAGPGLQDSTRIAASDPALWGEVLRRNAGNLAPLVRSLAQDLSEAADRLAVLAAEPGAEQADHAVQGLLDLLARGVHGRRLVPVKRGERDAAFVAVAVAVPDRPGQLARLFTTAADGEVNVEDVRVDNVPGRPQGVIELVVRTEARRHAEQVLRAAGWDVLASS